MMFVKLWEEEVDCRSKQPCKVRVSKEANHLKKSRYLLAARLEFLYLFFTSFTHCSFNPLVDDILSPFPPAVERG